MAAWKERVRRALRAVEPYHVPPLQVEVKLDANESSYGLPHELLVEAAEVARRAELNRYPDPRAERLREVVAKDLGQAPERLVFGNGGDELIALLCQAFAEPPPGRSEGCVVYPAPSFVVFRTAAMAAGMLAVEAPLGARFAPDGKALARAIAAAEANLVFLATPNNPTGTVWPRPLVEELVGAFPGTVFIIDQAYVGYGGEDLADLVEAYEHCAVLRTYSKIGLAGLRLGVLIARPELAHEVEKVRPPYNVGVLPQRVAELAIGRYGAALRAHQREVAAERDRLAEALGALPEMVVFPSGANLLLVRVPGARAVWQKLVERSILVRAFGPGPLADCLRITIGTPAENRRLLEALREVMAQ